MSLCLGGAVVQCSDEKLEIYFFQEDILRKLFFTTFVILNDIILKISIK